MKRLVVMLAIAAGCVRPAEERTLDDLEVGSAAAGGLAVTVDEWGGQVVHLEGDRVDLWAQAPVVRASITADDARDVVLTVDNCMPGSEIEVASADGDPLAATARETDRSTLCRVELALPAGDAELSVGPPDADTLERFRFVAMGDIQTALPSVHEVFERINQEPGVRFVISMGDLVEDGYDSEYALLVDKLQVLEVPYYSTIGNHELHSKLARWRELFGRINVHFTFKGVDFSFVDSGNASIDPMVYDWLDGWLDDARDRVHVFGTHYPPIDPVGARAGSFRSRKEAAKLLARLAEGAVDVTLYGHIHSYYAYDNAGIPAYISGGGGALPEKLDGIGRHFLVLEADPADADLGPVGVVRVDD